MRRNKSLIAAALLCTAMPVSAWAAPVIDGINQTATPINTTWAANNLGWYYTPTLSYNLTGLATRFLSADGRSVNARIYSGDYGALTLLGEGTLTASTAFTSATFAPVSLTAGTRYVFGFGNVAGLGVNVTGDRGATNLPGGLRYDYGAANAPTYQSGPETGFTAQPIVQFEGLAVASGVPEPASWALFTLGFGVAGGALRRRAKTRTTVHFA